LVLRRGIFNAIFHDRCSICDPASPTGRPPDGDQKWPSMATLLVSRAIVHDRCSTPNPRIFPHPASVKNQKWPSMATLFNKSINQQAAKGMRDF
jgi:hypothetical protein